MKKSLILWLALLCSINLFSQSFSLCVGSSTTAVASGTVYDSGGPTGYYQNYEYCTFLVNPGCTGTIALTFSSFSSESGYDYLSVYNGSTTSSPLLGSYSGSSLPPTLYANSGKLLLVWSSDGSYTYQGFSATWTSTLAGTSPPVANFSMNLNPPLNSPFQFTDLTTNSPYQWYWQFGDGTTSTLQNPVKTYTSSGVKSVTLTATNCNSSNTAVYSLTVQPAPIVSVSPLSISGSVSCGASLVVPITLSNTGSGAMTYSFSNVTSTVSQIKVLAITNYVDMSSTGEYYSTISALSTFFTNYTLTPHSLTSVSAFSTALSGMNVLLIPEQETYFSGFMQTYSATINNFVSAGGTAILCGAGDVGQINDIGLFTCSSINWVSPTITVIDTLSPIMASVPIGTINATNATWSAVFTNSGNTDYVQYLGDAVVTKRNIGSGRAIYLGFDYYVYDNNTAKMLANSVRSALSPITWFTTTSTSGSVATSSSVVVTHTFNSSNLAAGVYTQNVILLSNSPTTPSLSIPVSFTVSGSAVASISPLGCINFGTIMQNTSKLDSLVLYNTGCATMSVSSMSLSNPAFNYTPTGTFTIAAFSSKKIYLGFSPVSVGNYSATLQIVSNAGTNTTCLNGAASIAPTISVSPGSLSASLPACNSTQTVSLNIMNAGGANLIYNIAGGVSGASVNVLAITNDVDMSSSGEYQNMISAANSYFTNYSITQHYLTTVSAFQTALTGRDVLIIPEQEYYTFGSMQTYSTTINNFANAGGLVIICGTYDPNQLNDIGLFNTTAVNLVGVGSTLNVLDTTDLITKTLPLTTIAQDATIGQYFTTSGVTDLIKYGTQSVVSKRTVGLGKAIYLGFDYYAYDINTSKLIANSIKSSKGLVSWLSGAGSTGTLAAGFSNNITYTFNTAGLTGGTYTYNLLINSNDPLTPTYTVPVSLTVGNNPCANFSFTNPNNCSGIVTFTENVINAVTSYSWNFGDGNSSTSANPVHSYSNPGTYTVSLTACFSSSCSTITKTLNITNVGGPLNAVCTPTSYFYGSYIGILNVSFNTINKTSGYAYPEGYQDFSCTNQTTLSLGSSYLLNVSTSPSSNENVSVWIDLDNNGTFSPSELILTTYNQLITHTLNFSPPAGAVLNTPLRMRVTDENYYYTISGPCYNSSYGQTEDYAVVIKPINVPPVANYNYIINQCQGKITFNDVSSNTPTSWTWNFGDGGASTLQNPVHTYTAGGTYTVTLIAGNSFGTSFQTKVVTIANPLSFNISYTGNMMNSPVSFSTNLSGGQVYTWSFGDGNTSGSQNPVNTYSAMGSYVASLTIVSGSCVNTATTLVVISDALSIKNSIPVIDKMEVFPNPFNKNTEIKLRVNDMSKIDIQLINNLGQVIRTINDQYLNAGEHTFYLEEIPAGIYYLKVDHMNSIKTFKLISTQ